jgi:NitT/TauT family transport system permease protein
MSYREERFRGAILGSIGTAVFLVIWQVVGVYQLGGLTVPSFTQVLDCLLDPSRRTLFLRSVHATCSKAALGYLIGSIFGTSLATTTYMFPVLRPGMDRLFSILHAIPALALAPIFIILVDRERTGLAIAVLDAHFALYVATISGLAKAERAHRDFFMVMGASAWTQFLHLDLPAAVPTIITGMKYAVPITILGAILGEWLGSSQGLGLLMMSAMQNFQISLLWSAVMIASGISLAMYGLMGLVEQAVNRRFE